MKAKKIRPIIDILMLITMIIMMGYQVTGNKWHEIIGIGLFILFVIHCLLNRYWFRHFFKIGKNAVKQPALLLWFISNVLVLINLVILAISSIFISKTVFSGLNLPFIRIMCKLHTFSAYGGLIVMSIHLGCHWNKIYSSIRNSLGIAKDNKTFTLASRLIAFFLAILGILSSFRQNIGTKLQLSQESKKAKSIHGKYIPTQEEYSGSTNKQQRQHSDSKGSDEYKNEKHSGSQRKRDHDRNNDNDQNNFQKKYDQTNNTSSDTDYDTNAQQIINSDESEEDYLSRLTCTGCGRHCLLSAPACGTGRAQAENAKRNYENSSSENTTVNSDGDSKNTTISKNKIVFENDDLLDIFKDYIPIVGLYVCGTYYTIEFLKKIKDKKKDN